MTKTDDRDHASELILQIRGACGPHIIAGINGNLPPGWHASNLTAHRREPPPSQRVAVFCSADRISACGNGVGAKLEVQAGEAEADKLRLADALAEQLCMKIDLFQEVRAAGHPRVKVALAPGAVLPARKTPGSSGYDLCALEGCQIQPGRIARIRTGVHLEIPPGLEAQVRPRSGWSARGIWVPLGTVDADYRGECWIIAANLGTEAATIAAGDRLAQLVFARVASPDVQVVELEQLSRTERGVGGLGSTGA